MRKARWATSRLAWTCAGKRCGSLSDMCTARNHARRAGLATCAAAAATTRSFAGAARPATTYEVGSITTSGHTAASSLSGRTTSAFLDRIRLRMKFECDVCVVGAGPAGATYAARMAQMGRQVLLLERLPFPRPHVGEAMTPAVLDLLDVSGARAAVEALGVVHTPRARVRWVDGKVNLVASPSGRPGFTVDR